MKEIVSIARRIANGHIVYDIINSQEGNSKIKLIEIEQGDDCRRFSSQLTSRHKDVADFILKEGKMFVWGLRGGWVEYLKPYEIVTEITYQEL